MGFGIEMASSQFTGWVSMGTLRGFLLFSKDMIDDVMAGVCRLPPGLPSDLYI